MPKVTKRDEGRWLKHSLPNLLSILKYLHHSATVTTCPHPTSSVHARSSPSWWAATAPPPPTPMRCRHGGGGTWIWGQLTHPTPLATHGVFLPGSKGVQPWHTLSMLESRQHESAQRHYNFSSHPFMLSGQEHPMLSQQKSSLVQSKLRFSSIDPSSWSWRHLFSQSQYSASQ